MCWKNAVRLLSLFIVCLIVANIIPYLRHKYKYPKLFSSPRNVKWKTPISDSDDDIVEDKYDDESDYKDNNKDEYILPKDNNEDNLDAINDEIDNLVPEYVEEMNDYIKEEDNVGSSIADIYDNLTRAPDISKGRDIKMISDSAIGPLDTYASEYSTY
jgi:hypothetical protein